MIILKILLVIVLIPVGAYLSNQIYRGTHGNATIGRDIESLYFRFTEWRERRAYRKELKRERKASARQRENK